MRKDDISTYAKLAEEAMFQLLSSSCVLVINYMFFQDRAQTMALSVAAAKSSFL